MEYPNKYIIDADEFYQGLSHDVVLNLLKDEEELSEEEKLQFSQIKDSLIKSEIINLSDEDVLSDIRLVENNIPDDITTLEKIRWLYINLGKLFSYDYRVVNDIKYGIDKPLNLDVFIGRYQTCIQISEILAHELNKIEGVKCNIIKRKLTEGRGLFGKDHVANEVIFTDENGVELKLLLDLTLDLYLIQADCKTLHFGYEDDGTGTYDIIFQQENKDMDLKLGFITDDEDYTNDKIEKIATLIKQTDFYNIPAKDIINYRISLINKLIKKFPGYHEGKQYINLLFRDLLKAYYHEYNLFYNDEEQVNLKTIYLITLDDAEKWIIYSNKSGFISTSKEKLLEMLNNGWMTNSNSLIDMLNKDTRRIL